MNHSNDPAPRRRNRLRLTLGGMIVSVVVIGTVIGRIAYTARVQREAVAYLLKQPNSQVDYDWQYTNDRFDVSAKPPESKWVRDTVGSDVFDTVVAVKMSSSDSSQIAFQQVGKLYGLKRFIFYGSRKPLPRNAAAYIGKLRRLQSIQIEDVPKSEVLFSHLASATRLEVLEMPTAAPSDADMTHIGNLKALESLSVDGKNTTDAGFVKLAGLTRLKRIEMDFAPRISTLEPLRGMNDLEVLVFNNLGRKVEGLSALSLEPLRGKSKLAVVGFWSPIDENGLAGIETLANLRTFYAGGNGITDKGVAQLAKLPKLASLLLSGPTITDQAVARLNVAPSLRHLTLRNTNVRDLRVFRPVLEKLSSLSITNSTLDAEGLSGLSNLQSISRLDLVQCSIAKDGASKPETADAIVAHLIGSPKLAELSLTRTRVTDAAISNLCKFRSLTKLEIYGAEITPAGEQALRKALPGLRITQTKPSDD